MMIPQSCARGYALWDLSVLGSSVSLKDENSPLWAAGRLVAFCVGAHSVAGLVLEERTRRSPCGLLSSEAKFY